MTFTRRQILGSSAFITASLLIPTPSIANGSIFVTKGRGCGCCTAWVEILKQEGFEVMEEEVHPTDLVQLKMKLGIPQTLFSCHTGQIGQYVIEGHVPTADIRRLLLEKPEAKGLSVPDMPYGSPGMGPESERDAYDVILFKDDGTSEVFTRYEAA